MFPGPFEYVAVATVGEAVQVLQQHESDEDAKILAGGHSLLPMMKLRLAAPGLLIDIGRIPGLAGVQAHDGALAIGSLTTYSALLASADAARFAPLLPETAAKVGDTQVRNRGTIGGSVAHADPAGDLPASLLALDATFTAQGPDGERQVAARDFFQGLFMTDLQATEVLTRITVPYAPPRTGMAYEKFRNPASGYAIVGVAAVVTLHEDGSVASARVAVTGAGPQPTRVGAVEEALAGQTPDDQTVAAAASHAADALDLMGDIHASAEYRGHLTRVHARRAIARAIGHARA